MKTIDQLKKIIEETKEDCKKNATEKTLKKLNERIQYLERMILFLKTEPKEEVLKKQIVRLSSEIDILEKRYENWLRLNLEMYKRKDSKTIFNKGMGITEKKKEIETLTFIIN
jgi:molecular chaperone GrpE (heat shock protein)